MEIPRIESIKLVNFRQYRDCKVHLPLIKGKSIVVIQGVTGSGKSNLLNALSWCLYGEEINLKKDERSWPLVNTLSVSGSRGPVEVQVQVDMGMEDGGKYRFLRRLRCEKVGKNEISVIPFTRRQDDVDIDLGPDQSQFQVFELPSGGGGDWEIRSHPNSIVRSIMPRKIREYFLFDGERLDEYFKQSDESDRKDRIKEEIFKVSQLDIVEKILDRLGTVNDDIRKEGSGGIEGGEELLESIERTKIELQEKQEELKKIDTDREKANASISRISDILKKYAATQSLARERENLETRIKELAGKLEETEIEKYKHLSTSGPLIYLKIGIGKTLKLIEKAGDDGKIPPQIQSQLLKQALKVGKCICGTSLISGDPRKQIEKLLAEIPDIEPKTSEVIELNTLLKEISEKANEFLPLLKEINKEISTLRENLVDLRKQREEIGLRIQEVGGTGSEENFVRLEEQRKEYEEVINESGVKKGGIQKERDILAESLVDLKKQYDEKMRKRGEMAELVAMSEFCQKSVEVLENIKSEIMGELREGIEKRTDQIFNDIHWKKYYEISIDKEYNVSVKDPSNREFLGNLSAGERQILAFAFLAALNVATGFQVPIVIDTPLARLAKDVKGNVVENLVCALPNRQLILLVTDVEYSRDIREKLSQYTESEHKIDFKEYPDGAEADIVDY